MKKAIIIVSGDPNSINSEIIYKSWKKISGSLKQKIYIISNYDLIKDQFKKLNYSIKLQKVNKIDLDNKNNKLKIINVGLNFIDPFNVSNKLASKYVLESLNLAHKIALRNNVLGIINCAVNKNLLNKKKIGVTEYLASKCNVKNNSEVMLIRNKKLSVCPITTHININEISKKLDKLLIINKIITINNWHRKKFKKKPKIAVLGLNPHNAELRKDSEETTIIVPALKRLKNLKINAKGPFVADTIFMNDYKNYDVIVGMFHDQVLAPFKSIFKFNAINLTLGLKYLRASPDHGTAFNLIGKNKANITSFLECIKVIDKLGR
tara:strand:- start:1207 stop:2172 length:966 start_codon:yes stop_codon:yes gene_type:complete